LAEFLDDGRTARQRFAMSMSDHDRFRPQRQAFSLVSPSPSMALYENAFTVD
jgi:hypothetical protein